MKAVPDRNRRGLAAFLAGRSQSDGMAAPPACRAATVLLAVASVFALGAAGCSSGPAPQTVTRRAEAGGAQPMPQAPAPPTAGTAAPAAGAPSGAAPVRQPAVAKGASAAPAAAHSSEAEPKTAPGPVAPGSPGSPTTAAGPAGAQPAAAAAGAALPAPAPTTAVPATGAPAGTTADAVTAGAASSTAASVAAATAGSGAPAPGSAPPTDLAFATAPAAAGSPASLAPGAGGETAVPGARGAAAAGTEVVPVVVPVDGAAGRKNDPSVVVVEPADSDPEAQLSLADAAKVERERKAQAPPPRIVINDRTIHRYARNGQLTVADPKKKGSGTPAAPVPAAAAATPGAGAPGTTGTMPIERDERYWRGRALEIRQRWRKAADRIKVLEGDANLWRRRFYAEDDPYTRDGQIKPAWDRVLDELRESKAMAAAAKKELADFLEEGRVAGALPGWLREGVELEPKEEKPVDPTQPIETPIFKDPGR